MPSTVSSTTPPTQAESGDSAPAVARLLDPDGPQYKAPFGAVIAIVSMAIGGFAIGTTEFASMGLLPDIAGSLGISEVQAGHLITAYAIGVVVGAPLLAALGSRVRRRTLLVVFMAILVAGHLLSVLAPNYELLMVARFVSALPHGAYFGIASLMAASLVPVNRRGSAVASMLMGLTVANVVGVPLTTALGQHLGWRSAYALVGVLGLVTLVSVRICVPQVPLEKGASLRGELGALRNPRIWLTLALAAIGFGGMFAVYTYIAPMMTSLAGFAPSGIPWLLAAFGVGGTLGMVIGGMLADRSPDRAILTGFIATIVVFAGFSVTSGSQPWSFVNVALLGLSGSMLVPSVQVRLMQVSAGAQGLAASLNHSAFNVANALGAWLGGVVLAASWGYLGPSYVAVVLGSVGLTMFIGILLAERRQRVSSHRRASVRPAVPDTVSGPQPGTR